MLCRVLGPLEVVVDDEPVRLGGLKQRAVLALLLAAGGHTVSVDRLIDEVWSDAAPNRALDSLQVFVSNLRRLLEPHRAPRSPSTVLVTRPPGYALVVDPACVDAAVFTETVAIARPLIDTEPGRAVALFDRALGLWRGDAYGDVAAVGTTLGAEATRLDGLRQDVIEDRWRAVLAGGGHREAVPALEAQVAAVPLREGAWGLLALALYRSQRQADALEALRRARGTLADELGIDPGPELRALQEAILRQDAALDARRAASVVEAEAAGSLAAEPGVSSLLLGRQGFLAEAQPAIRSAAVGEGRVVLLTGEPGIGKTRLAEAIAESAREHGFGVGAGRADEEGGAPELAPITAALTGLAAVDDDSAAALGLLRRQIEDDQVGATDADSAAYRVADRIGSALASFGRPTCLVIDDLHWAPPDTLRVLRQLLVRVTGLPLLLVLTTREAEADITGDLADTLGVLARTEPLRLALRGLSTDDVAELVRLRQGETVPEAVAEAIRARTDGNPFYVGELATLLGSEHTLRDPSAVETLDVPDGVRDIVRRRLARLTDATAIYLTTAAAVGRSFEHDIVQAGAGLNDEEADDALEAAVLAGLVGEDSPGRYRFAHALVREAVYAGVPAPRLVRIHGRVAGAIETLRPGQDAYRAELARHHFAAGPANAPAAWRQAAAAAQLVDARLGPNERERLCRLAVDAARLDPALDPAEKVELLVALGRARRDSGQIQRAWSPLAEAAETGLEAGDPVAAARAVSVIGHVVVWTWRSYGEVDREAIALCERLLVALPDEEPLLRAHVMAILAIELYYDPDGYERRDELSARALELARPTAGPDLLSELLIMRYLALEHPARLADRRVLADELVTVADEAGDPVRLGSALLLRGSSRLLTTEMRDAVVDIQRSSALAQSSGSVPLLVPLAYLAPLLPVCRGEFDRAEQLLQEAEELHATSAMMGLDTTPVAHLIEFATLRGRLDAFEPQLRSLHEHLPRSGFTEALALALVHAGRLDEAAEIVGPWHEAFSVLEDYVWLPTTVVRAWVRAALGDHEATADLHARLEPFRGCLAVGGTGVLCMGLVDETLGLLALGLGEIEAAVADLSTALRWYDEVGFRAFHVRASHLLAAAHRRRGERFDTAAAEAEAEALGVRVPPGLIPAS